MPSSGFPIESFSEGSLHDNKECQELLNAVTANAEHAMKTGMFIEWLECFVGAYNHMKSHQNRINPKMADEMANIASQAGIIEWDM